MISYLSLGSNLGDRAGILQQAIELLPLMDVRISPVYEAEAWGTDPTDPWFLNCVVAGETQLEPLALQSALQKIEQQLGRDRTHEKRNAPRTIDIDILFYDDLIFESDHLMIPHERLALRRFVLVPLNDLAPEFVHPVLRKSVKELLKVCTDNLIVRPPTLSS